MSVSIASPQQQRDEQPLLTSLHHKEHCLSQLLSAFYLLEIPGFSGVYDMARPRLDRLKNAPVDQLQTLMKAIWVNLPKPEVEKRLPLRERPAEYRPLIPVVGWHRSTKYWMPRSLMLKQLQALAPLV